MDTEKKQSELDKRYIRMASIWAENSYCQRRKVGALIVKDKMIISDGYNGTPSGFENVCEDENNLTKPYVLHVEAGAVALGEVGAAGPDVLVAVEGEAGDHAAALGGDGQAGLCGRVGDDVLLIACTVFGDVLGGDLVHKFQSSVCFWFFWYSASFSK